ncbi:hypothetical protein [Candidatus Regiella insecticola]|uniref:Uncharacterized protein n=1 Tax=Candidatus Regiella insecticola TaxID=138073 RepID=A0A6L2ZR86_9ENTR|nr:hypothetical protein [Candidatus Regiella insecticola]GFN47039.1 hypothetical protein RINTU1_28910 [Candidatus Regiella insecticola]
MLPLTNSISSAILANALAASNPSPSTQTTSVSHQLTRARQSENNVTASNPNTALSTNTKSNTSVIEAQEAALEAALKAAPPCTPTQAAQMTSLLEQLIDKKFKDEMNISTALLANGMTKEQNKQYCNNVNSRARMAKDAVWDLRTGAKDTNEIDNNLKALFEPFLSALVEKTKISQEDANRILISNAVERGQITEEQFKEGFKKHFQAPSTSAVKTKRFNTDERSKRTIRGLDVVSTLNLQSSSIISKTNNVSPLGLQSSKV